MYSKLESTSIMHCCLLHTAKSNPFWDINNDMKAFCKSLTYFDWNYIFSDVNSEKIMITITPMVVVQVVPVNGPPFLNCHIPDDPLLNFILPISYSITPFLLFQVPNDPFLLLSWYPIALLFFSNHIPNDPLCLLGMQLKIFVCQTGAWLMCIICFTCSYSMTFPFLQSYTQWPPFSRLLPQWPYFVEPLYWVTLLFAQVVYWMT